MDVLSYQLDSAEQFWDELHDIASGDYHSTATLEQALCAYIHLATLYVDQYLITDEDLTRCGYNLINSTIFSKNRAYGRRKLISLLVHGQLDIPNKVLIGAVLLIDGRMHESTLEMMQEEAASLVIIKTLWLDRHKSVRMHRIYMELMYEMCRVQKLSRYNLDKIKLEAIEFMFNIVESNDFYETDPYNYAAMKVLLALNEQYMITDVDAENSSDMIENKVFKVIREHGDNYRTFGENLVFLFNRGIDDTLQLMMMKLLYLIFTSKSTFEYIYYNDLKVMTEVMMRELRDLSHDEEKLRHTYLRVVHPLLQNTPLKDDGYKRCELIALLELFLDGSVYDETTVRLADRCLSVDWLNYEHHPNSRITTSTSTSNTTTNVTPQAAADSPPSTISSTGGSHTYSPSTNSSTSSLATSMVGGDEKRVPPPPPPRKSKSASSESKVAHAYLKPPVPHPRKVMSIRNTSEMDIASYR